MAAFIQPITAALGAGIGLWSGAQNVHAAGAAANTRTGAYQDARDIFRQGMDTGNTYLQDASGKAIDWAGKAGDYAQSTALDTAARTSADVSGRAATAGQGVLNAAGAANTMLDPYRTAGAGALTQIGDLANKQFTFGQDDPSYQWRLQQGQQALERSQAARGGSMGGAAAKAMARYGQGAASTEYGAAYNRFLEGRQQQLGALGGLAQLGYGASGQAGQNLIGANRYAGDVNLQAGEWGGNTENRAAEYAGNAGMQTAQYAGNVGTQTARDLAGNLRWGTGNMADMTINRADSIASGILGQQAGKNQMWSAAGQGLMAGSSMFAPRAPGMSPSDMGWTPPPPGTYGPISGMPTGI